ncbi:polysaccharide deacetylase family protein [Bacillus sp. HSf4]|uniref:polysaccharide deacetylase family protein n=1 Tax=Bacillus sp. HSf4 TaxID=3035514 RepID=UPI00240A72F6|nr:polysaccharide deacetylase family protein [Bacillus sp. HSf4]WFA05928.1 polysaccharide deacetylase family protein [Bacillus sp. HSf4]
MSGKRSWRWINVLIFLAIFIGFAGYSFNHVSSNEEAPPPKPKKDPDYSDIEIGSFVSDSEQERYAIHYPIFHIKAIDDKLKGYVKDELSRFKKDSASARSRNEDGPFELNIKYKIVYYTKQTAAIVLNEYIESGGAPGKTTIKTFNADLKQKKCLALHDLFIDDAGFLNRISGIVYQQLKNDHPAADDALLKKGTSPLEQNFSRFALLENDIEFYFGKEQTGVEQSVKIKKEWLKDILKDQYREGKKNRVDNKQKQEAIPLPKEAKVNPDEKVIALTFDDGPNPSSTNKVLDALKKYEGHATFFVLGSRAQVYPETITRMMREGNEVGNHSWDHPLLTRLTNDKAYKEIDDTQQVIENISGHTPTRLRPPYGGVNDSVRGLTGLSITLWDVDPEDWKVKNKQKIVNRVMSQAGDGKIILMHDIYQTSADAAEEIIRRLKRQGYQLVTVSQLEKVKKQREQ